MFFSLNHSFYCVTIFLVFESFVTDLTIDLLNCNCIQSVFYRVNKLVNSHSEVFTSFGPYTTKLVTYRRGFMSHSRYLLKYLLVRS